MAGLMFPGIMPWLNLSFRSDFVPGFAVDPQSHNGAVVLALFPAQVRRPSGLARVLPRRDGIVQAGSGTWDFAAEFWSSHVVAAVWILLHGS